MVDSIRIKLPRPRTDDVQRCACVQQVCLSAVL